MIRTEGGRVSGRGCTGPARATAVFILLAASIPLGAQSPLLSGFNLPGGSQGGWQIYDIAGFAGWESVVNPQSGFFLPNNTSLQGDELLGASGTVGWSRRNQRTSFSLVYTGGYLGQIRYSNLSAFNQMLSLNATRRLTAKWSAGFAATSSVSTYDQMLFSPTVFSSVVAAPGSFSDLSSAVLAGKYTNDQLASILTGAPVIESPARTVFFGNRVFTTSAATSLSYAHSQRLSISFGVNGSRSQHLNDGQQQDAPQYVYLIPQATEVSSTLSLSYSLTPRTQVGVSLSGSRGFSQIQEAYTTYGTVFVGRNMGRHWFAQVRGGSGYVANINRQFTGNNGTTPVFGGSLGYKTYAHSFLGAYDRSLSQTYGAGAADTITISAAWHWWRPGRRWGLSSDYMEQQFRGGVFGDANGWRAAFGVTRQMGDHAVLETGYTYASYTSKSPTFPYDSQQNAVRVSVMWIPRSPERP